jgi:predicted Ser/Thr protein kinase
MTTAGDVPSRIGPFPVERELGRGGMGVVYLARDPELNRQLAIKVLAPSLVADSEHRTRFEREARLLAALSHPNVGAIYAVGSEGDRRYLALEYVPGQTLAARLERGPLALEEALATTAQVAAALEAAHERGIVHRDLKPANVRITPEGVVKVLDFGLARSTSAPQSASELDHSPTLTRATASGVMLGTVPYMSPEQARGLAIDKRTDLWALGCLLFECLTGKAAFGAISVSDTLVRILEREPDWSALPVEVPRKVQDLLRRCLEKDQRRRMRDAGDARLELEEAAREGRAGDAAPVRHAGTAARMIRWLVAAVAGAFIGAAGLWLVRDGGSPAAAATTWTSIVVPPTLRVRGIKLAPDGRWIGLLASERDDRELVARIYVRPLDREEVIRLPGTERARGLTFSPDADWIYFYRQAGDENLLFRVATDGHTPAVALGSLPAKDFTVLANGDVLSTDGHGLQRLTGRLEPAARIAIRGPQKWKEPTYSLWEARPLPDGRLFVDAAYSAERGSMFGTALLDPATGVATAVLDDGGRAQWLGEHLLFTRGAVLLGAKLDVRHGTLASEPVPLVASLLTWNRAAPAGFGLGRDGTLLFLDAGPQGEGEKRRLIALEPGGEPTVWGGEGHRLLQETPKPAPDGNTVAQEIAVGAHDKLEIWRFGHDGSAAPLVSFPSDNVGSLVWSPDGQEVAYVRYRMGPVRGPAEGVFLQHLDGGPPRLVCPRPTSGERWPAAWSRDGRTLLLGRSKPDGDVDIERLDVRAALRGHASPTPWLTGGQRKLGPVFSPDGRLLAYVEGPQGQSEVVVRELGEDGAFGPRLPIPNALYAPHWSPDGRRLYSYDGKGRIVATPIGAHGRPTGPAEPVADILDLNANSLFNVLPDGRLLLLQVGEREWDFQRAQLVLGFDAELERRLQ